MVLKTWYTVATNKTTVCFTEESFMTENQIELLRIVSKSSDPEKTIRLAAAVIYSLLPQHEVIEEQQTALLQEAQAKSL